jgi:hypothetical protein
MHSRAVPNPGLSRFDPVLGYLAQLLVRKSRPGQYTSWDQGPVYRILV